MDERFDDALVHFVEAVAVDIEHRKRLIGNIARDIARRVARELLLPVDSITQRFPAYVRHHVVEERLHVSGVMQWEDVWMLQPSKHPDLANEAELAGLGCRVSV